MTGESTSVGGGCAGGDGGDGAFLGGSVVMSTVSGKMTVRNKV